MEMNTRIQVEHPVTEMVTGYDLVALQLEVACGGRLPPQEEIRLSGHAVEARLCAEDPRAEFRPSSGRLERFRIPEDQMAGGRLRLDSAVEESDIVPSLYDSMIAKVIVHAPTRGIALRELSASLGSAEVWPLATNAGLLSRLLISDPVVTGVATTEFIEDNLERLSGSAPEEIRLVRAAGLEAVRALEAPQKNDPWTACDGFRLNSEGRILRFVETPAGGDEFLFTVSGDGAALFQDGDGGCFPLGARVVSHGVAEGSIRAGSQSLRVTVRKVGATPVAFFGGEGVALSGVRRSRVQEGADAGDEILAPMPGRILDVRVAPGDVVKRGDTLIVMEAMKMEYSLTAPRDGRVGEVSAAPGGQTREGACLLRMASDEDGS